MARVLSFLLLLSCAAFVAVAHSDDEPAAGEEHVLVLTEQNFDEEIAKNEFILVEFYAPWCGHCKRLAPEYAKAAARLVKEDPPLVLAKVDATEQQSLGSRFGVRGYPTLKFFRNGEATDYNGGRSEMDIVNWMKKKCGPPAKTVSSGAEMDKLAEENAVVVLGLFKDQEEAQAIFNDVAASNDDVVFVITSSDELLEKYAVSAPSVVLLKHFDEKRNDFNAEFTKDALSHFVKSNAVPLVMGFDQQIAQKLFSGAFPALFLMRDPASEAGQAAEKEFREAAPKLKGRVLLSVSGVEDALEKRLLSFIGVEASQLPTVRLVKPGDALLKYAMAEEAITAAALEQFVTDFENKKVKPFLKSEAIPESNDGPVTVLVGKNFEEIVMNEDKDVLVEFYAPWCGHCKHLEPIYNELAESLKDVSSLVIAKMDATANEVENVSVRGFPTIKFFPAKDKANAIDFKGDRTKDGFVSFLKSHASIPFDAAKDEL